jgi:hypothetical protein
VGLLHRIHAAIHRVRRAGRRKEAASVEEAAIALLRSVLGVEEVRAAVAHAPGDRDVEGLREGEQREGERPGSDDHENQPRGGEDRRGQDQKQLPLGRPRQHRPSIAVPRSSWDDAGHPVERAGGPDLGRWLSVAVSAGGCVRPVRLRPSMFRADPGDRRAGGGGWRAARRAGRGDL